MKYQILEIYDISDNYKYISTQEFKKLTEERFAGKLKQANLVN